MARQLAASFPAIAGVRGAARAGAIQASAERPARYFRRGSGSGHERSIGQWLSHPSVVMRGWHPRDLASPRPPFWHAAGAALLRVLDRFADWQDRARSRRALLTLDDRALHDIGLDRATAAEEGSAPFWRTRT